MPKCLDEGIPWRHEEPSYELPPDSRLKLFELKDSYEVEMADGTNLPNGDKVTSFKTYWDAIKFMVRTGDQIDDKLKV